MKTWLISLPLICGLSGCGDARHDGDAEGEAVRFDVHLERGFVRAMHNRQWTPSGTAVVTSDNGGGTNLTSGISFTFSATSVYLFGGTTTGAADIFMHQLSWGDNDFTIPLTPGRRLFLTIKAEGGREGWEALSTSLIPAAPDAHVVIRLSATQEAVAVTPVIAPHPSASERPSGIAAGASADASTGAVNAGVSPSPAPTASAAAAPVSASSPPTLSANPPLSTTPGEPPNPPAATSTAPVTAPSEPPLVAPAQTPAAAVAPPGDALTLAPASASPPPAAPDAATTSAPRSGEGTPLDTRAMPDMPAGTSQATPQAGAGQTPPAKKLPNIFAPPVPAVSPAAPYPDPALQDK